MWYAIAAGAIVVVLFIIRQATRTPDPPPTAEEIRLKRWGGLRDHIATKYQLRLGIPCPTNHMDLALARRGVLVEMVRRGHAKAAANVLFEVDNIIETLEANVRALDEYHLGQWVSTGKRDRSGSELFEWKLNHYERPAALREETEEMLDSLNGLIAYVRSIAKEGVAASIESAKVHLQVHLQDFTAAKEANAQTAKELEARPL